ncbi:hypothetical protein J5N97_002338 [Dioscorea zingiberensis]|uniref:Membrane lipoprotein n=1 Tax=Dioscorea zingiberensis TaxID=325984 RepID=A0A9D5D435_9LILI|nr:hypothetical protein J5N97_002338 [Dioscorea zingiberensis]
MRPLNSLGIGLSLVFGCLFLALIAELYYLLWWKKRFSNRDDLEGDYVSPAKEIFCLFCWRRPSSLSSTALNPQEMNSTVDDGQLHLHSNSGKDLLLKSFDGEEGLEAELMRLHNLSGPPRFLFTIKEETKEDMESEDGKSKGGRSRRGSKGRSLSDVLFPVETPFLTPLSSPPFFTPPLTPLSCYNQHGLNPLFESSKEDDFNKMKLSPPPKFKFLKDAEEKLYRRTLMEEALRVHRNGVATTTTTTNPPPCSEEEEEGSFITIIIGKNRDKGHQHHSSSSQVTPLSSSPSTIRPSHA